ncbi:Concanavalin A-like lectin/glucanases superfamily [uncultured Caudovirales phage]|uniref:Concanavalin A-like lectin/glucanases superfamily n=1 Tax=uncultured Caudovirales phage TaxID=2100421 RepID=A0A6J5P6Q5_9CAUD|nr:Concanavalin A-like lectin/glucanases superfamily [uncultured Caudovirales phage]
MLSLLGSLRRGNFVTNSLRFRSSNSAFLTRTFTTPTNINVFTWSGWVKRGTLGVTVRLFGVTSTTNFGFNSNDQLLLTLNGIAAVTTAAVYRDPSAWYHIVYAQNGATQTIYVNGSSVGTGTTANPGWNGPGVHQIAAAFGNYFDGYLTEVNFIDGQALTPSSFGQIESTTGVWSPKQYVGTYGANGFYLKFADASAATAAAIGKDSSGNGNNWTPSGISVTAGVTYDSMLDVPVNYSDSGNGRGNYAVFNGVDNANSTAGTASDGNLRITSSGVTSGLGISRYSSLSTSGVNLYAEFTFLATSGSTTYSSVGVLRQNDSNYVALQIAGSSISGRIVTSAGVQQTTLGFVAANDIISIAVTAAGSITFYKNNIQIGISQALLGSGDMFFNAYAATGDAGASQASIAANFGQRPFTYTPPAGFRALNTNNLPTPSIVNGANFMAATTYTGTAGVQSILNAVNSVSFQPDLVWIKSRSPAATSHALFDSVRGTGKYLSSDTTAAETTNANTLTAFNGNGFSLGTDTTIVNANANLYIAWQWRKSITAGLDVVSYTGTGVNRTVAHNLGITPAMVIVKRSQTGATSNWQVRHTSIAATNSIQLNLPNQAAAATTVWASTAPTSSVFTVGASADVNASGISYVAYCFAEIAGFSKFGSYTGNGSTDGPFVFCGFRPKFLMYKGTTEPAANWHMLDGTMSESNFVNEVLAADSSTKSVTTGPYVDILSNGFKLRTSSSAHNLSGNTYIFAAFAEVPSKYALAR